MCRAVPKSSWKKRKPKKECVVVGKAVAAAAEEGQKLKNAGGVGGDRATERGGGRDGWVGGWMVFCLFAGPGGGA